MVELRKHLVLHDSESGKEIVRLTTADWSFSGKAFVFVSPDARKLAAGVTVPRTNSKIKDNFLFVWDISKATSMTQPEPANLSGESLEGMWKSLTEKDIPFSYKSLRLMATAPEQTIAFLKDKLHPATKRDTTRVEKMIALLDDDSFEKREQAEQDLLALGSTAATPLAEALKGTLSPEARTRAQRILEKVQTPLPTGDELRNLWAVDLLEQIGTTEAKLVIAKIATGDADAWLTREAKAALQRLDKRGVK